MGLRVEVAIVESAIDRALDDVAAARRDLRRSPRRRSALHRYREALRPFEGALALAQGAFTPASFARSLAHARRARRGLGRFRDADVLERRLAPLARDAAGEDSSGIEPLWMALRARRVHGRARAVREATAHGGGLLAASALASLRKRRLDLIEPLAFPAAAVRTRIARLARPEPDSRELHELRLAVKSFRFGAEALAREVDMRSALDAVAREAEEVTDLLGDISDAEGFCEGVESLLARERPARRTALATGVEAARVALLRDAEEARRDFIDGWAGARWPRLKAAIAGSEEWLTMGEPNEGAVAAEAVPMEPVTREAVPMERPAVGDRAIVALFFLRHGPAVEREAWSGPDEARPLTEEGERKLRKLRNGVARLAGSVDVVISSPFVRAKETALVVARKLDFAREVEEEPLLAPGVDAKAVVDVLARHRDAKRILLVGHSPSLEAWIARLVGAPEPFVTLGKGGLARVDVAAIAPEPRGVLRFVATPAMLERSS